jgi:hypothetical protein
MFTDKKSRTQTAEAGLMDETRCDVTALSTLQGQAAKHDCCSGGAPSVRGILPQKSTYL